MWKMDVGISFSIIYYKNIEETIWITTNVSFSFPNWLNVILKYGIIYPVDRLDPMKVTQQNTLLCSSEIGKPAQGLSGGCIDVGLFEEAKVCFKDLVPLSGLNSA